MALTGERKAALMAYCRMDDLVGGETALLETMYDAAVSYMAEAGVAEPKTDDPRRAQYDLCINALVLTDWDARGAQLLGTSLIDNPAFRRRVNQLKLTEPVFDSDTAE